VIEALGRIGSPAAVPVLVQRSLWSRARHYIGRRDCASPGRRRDAAGSVGGVEEERGRLIYTVDATTGGRLSSFQNMKQSAWR
jgi:hypothetical protein